MTKDVLAALAARALEEVEGGMRLGLGTGRAAEAFIAALGVRVAGGLEVVGVATSERSEAAARAAGVPTTTLDRVEGLDVAFDGADEVAPNLCLTKGLGGAMLRERVVAFEARRFVVLVTEEKLVDQLGTRAPIPIEVTPFAVASASRHLAKLGRPVRRLDPSAAPYLTDNGNAVIDLEVQPTADPRGLDLAIRSVPGVVDTGLFLGMASLVIVGAASGLRVLAAG